MSMHTTHIGGIYHPFSVSHKFGITSLTSLYRAYSQWPRHTMSEAHCSLRRENAPGEFIMYKYNHLFCSFAYDHRAALLLCSGAALSGGSGVWG